MKKALFCVCLLMIACTGKPDKAERVLLCDRPFTLQQFVLDAAPDSIATLVYTIVEVESNWRINASSHTGDHGLMQINKRWWGHRYDFERIYEPEYNINAGIDILTYHLRKGDVKHALTRYNGSEAYAHLVNRKHYSLFGEYLF